MELAHGEAALLLPTRYPELIDFQLFGYRLMSKFLAWSGLFALSLAVLGIYGVVAFNVTLRTREMAIRQALGARPGQVMREVISDGLKLTGWGLLAGLAMALPLATLLRSQLYGVSPLDPLAVGLSTAVLLSAALAASAVPARRLVKINTMTALREE